jgi:hypothetical protein
MFKSEVDVLLKQGEHDDHKLSKAHLSTFTMAKHTSQRQQQQQQQKVERESKLVL